jgi:hypothetical protein
MDLIQKILAKDHLLVLIADHHVTHGIRFIRGQIRLDL